MVAVKGKKYTTKGEGIGEGKYELSIGKKWMGIV